MWEDVHVLEDEDRRRLARVKKLNELAEEKDKKLLCEELAYDYVALLLKKKSEDVARHRSFRLLLRFLGPLRKFFLKEGKEESHRFEAYAKAAAEYLTLQEVVIREAEEWLRFEQINEKERPRYLVSFARRIVQD